MNSHTAELERYREQRAELAGDLHRPIYHFLAPANWLNDPNGMIQWDGQYHLFYQFNPHSPFHSAIHWGHAVSEDLLHWRDLPIALNPGPELYDQDGCWSGCAVDDGGVPTLVYTASFPQAVAVAVSHDGLLTWEKPAENPLISGPPPEVAPLAGGHFRDPFIWRDGDAWQMVIASKVEGRGGQILLYRSPDLRRWEYRGVLLAGDSGQTEPFWQGTMWECPNLLVFGVRRVLVLSVQVPPEQEGLYAVYFTGSLENERFRPEHSEILVHGGSFYAPQVMRAADGRHIMFGWLKEGRSQQACIEAGWNGAMSLPLTVELLPDGHLAVAPAQEVQALRREHWGGSNIALSADEELFVPEIAGKALEIKAEFLPDAEADFGLKVLCSPGEEEYTRIVYRRDSDQIFVERGRSGLDQRNDRNPATMPVSLADGEPARWRLFVDHSVLEVFVNDRLCLACRVYPSREDSREVRFFSSGGQSVIAKVDVWQMAPVWPAA